MLAARRVNIKTELKIIFLTEDLKIKAIMLEKLMNLIYEILIIFEIKKFFFFFFNILLLEERNK